MKKRVFSVFVSIVLILSLSAGALAANNLTEIKAYLNQGLKFTVNGQAWAPSQAPITYEGSTYLPIRAVAEAVGVSVGWDSATQTVVLGDTYDAILEFPADRFPSVAAHIASAILSGESAICTIDRGGADQRREQSLAGIPTRDGFDRDEWPMAMCAEGGADASVAYIDPSENRGAGSWVGNQLERYPDGTRVKFVVTFGDRDARAIRDSRKVEQSADGEVYYRSCAEARAAGAAPLKAGDPGYGRHLDRDGDGVACE